MSKTGISSYPVSDAEDLKAFVLRETELNFPSLDAQKKAFAHEYIISYKHRKAAEATGYNANTGISLLRDPLIAAYIEKLQEMQLTENLITKDFINTQRLELLAMATGDIPIYHVLGDGTEIKAKKTNVGEANTILRDLSKSIEYEKDTGQKNASVSVNIDMGSLFGDSPTPSGPIIDISPEDAE